MNTKNAEQLFNRTVDIIGGTGLCFAPSAILIPVISSFGSSRYGDNTPNDMDFHFFALFFFVVLVCAACTEQGRKLIWGKAKSNSEASGALSSLVWTIFNLLVMGIYISLGTLVYVIAMIVIMFPFLLGCRLLEDLETKMTVKEKTLKPTFREQSQQRKMWNIMGRISMIWVLVISMFFSPITIIFVKQGQWLGALLVNIFGIAFVAIAGWCYLLQDKIARMSPDEYTKHETTSLEKRIMRWEREQRESPALPTP